MVVGSKTPENTAVVMRAAVVVSVDPLLLLLLLGETGLKKASVGTTRRRSRRACMKTRRNARVVTFVVVAARVAVIVTRMRLVAALLLLLAFHGFGRACTKSKKVFGTPCLVRSWSTLPELGFCSCVQRRVRVNDCMDAPTDQRRPFGMAAKREPHIHFTFAYFRRQKIILSQPKTRQTNTATIEQPYQLQHGDD